MRILVSDYSGHPFQVQLSRGLAERGHDVLHVTSESFQTPKGRLGGSQSDPLSFRSVAVRTKQAFAKDSFIKRRRQEIEVGYLIAAQVREFRPDIVISSNAPLDTQKQIRAAAEATGASFVFWVQDLYGEAILRVLGSKLGLVGSLIGRFYRRLEGRLIKSSNHVVVISPEFVAPVMQLSGLDARRITVIENWAPIEELPTFERDNDWSSSNQPNSPFRVIYSGTLGFKHNPQLLLSLAKGIEGDVIVYSEGAAAENLKRQAKLQGVSNLHISGWLPFEVLPKALAGADLLVVILEPDAGIFSVPSKCLTYMCVGRPILGAIPSQNLAARLITGAEAGFVVEPDDESGFVAAAREIATSASRTRMGPAARRYAERAFDIQRIVTEFENIFNTLMHKGLKHD